MRLKKLTPIYLITALLFTFSCDPKNDNQVPSNETSFECGQMIGFDRRLATDPIFKAGLEKLEIQTNEYLNRLKENKFADFRSTVVTIPVVVHVVYKNTTENISDAKIQSQIDALNNFYRRMNADVSTVPAPFNALSSDVMIEFELAKRDPSCLPTNGITRTSTTDPNFTFVDTGLNPEDRNQVKFNSSGGRDGWPPDQYLNIWVCDLAGGLIGYASFPSELGTRASEDGVVMDYMGFGTLPPVFSGLDLGRVCGHEVGHWLNLNHIWGDDCPSGSQCSGTDNVTDTPNQECNNSGCPTFPKLDACATVTPGVMFMNQMDYTNDACRRLFTLGQSDRMAATLFTIRYSLLGSQGNIAPPSSAMADLWMKDTDEDLGNEPNIESTTFYVSDDIWVRNGTDGFTNQESQNPLGGGINHVYVRVRNKGCQTSATGAKLILYWAKASSGLSWPMPWDGSIVLTGTTLMGDEIDNQTITTPIPGNGSQIFHFIWNNTPDPSDYTSLLADLKHFCLLARIEESSGMTFPEVVGDLVGNVKNNNNIVWKNIGIEDTDGSGFSSTLVSNYTKENKVYTISIDGKKRNRALYSTGNAVPGTLYANFDNQLKALIDNNKVKVNGLQKTADGLYLLQDATAVITGLPSNSKQHYVVQLKFIPNKEFILGRYVYEVDLNQIDEGIQKVIGGQLFKFKHHEGS